MKILHYLWAANIGGIEKLVYDLALHQQREGAHDPALLFGQSGGPLYCKYQDSGLNISCADFHSGHDFSPVKLWRLKKLFDQHGLVHVHTYHPLIALAGILSRSPVVYTIHGTETGRRPRLQDRYKVFIRYFLFNFFVDFITFNSRFTQQRALTLYGLKKTPTRVVYNGIRLTPAAAPDQESGPGPELVDRCRDAFVVGTCSRFTVQKRLGRLIEGFAALADRRKAVLLLVGDGPARSDLEALVREKGLEDQAIFTGFVTNPAAFQDLMDVCVFPAHGDAFGLVAVETLNLGKPTIVFSDGGGLVEIIRDIEPQDVVANPAALTGRLANYLQAGSQTDAARHKRRQYAQNFSLERMSDDFREVYEQVAAKPAARTGLRRSAGT